MTHSEFWELPIPKRIARVMKDQGLTQETLASKLGTTRHQVNRWINGRATPSEEYAEKLAALGDYDTAMFTGETELERIARMQGEIRSLLTGAQNSLVEIFRMQGEAMKDQAALLAELSAAVAQIRAMLDDPAQPGHGQQ